MSEFSLPFLLGVVLATALTPLARRVALRIGAIDNPGERHIHAVATPRLGGPAILAALVLAMLFASLIDHLVGAMLWSQWRKLSWLAIGALMVTLVGAIDDVRPLKPLTKLLVEIAAASVAVYGGYRIESVALYHLGIFSFPLSVFFIVAAVNAINLVDGLDGLAVGLSMMISLTLLMLGLAHGQVELAVLLAALCGVLLGFLRYNFYPARIFLGDSGALLLGFVLGATAITTSHKMAASLAVAAPFLALGLPLAELMLTTTRRLVRALQIPRFDRDVARDRYLFKGLVKGLAAVFAADRDHIHHRLLSFGFNHRNAVLVLYAVGVMFCIVAVTLSCLEGAFGPPLLAALLVACAAGTRWLGYRELMPLRLHFRWPLLHASATRRKVVLATVDVASATTAAHHGAAVVPIEGMDASH